MYRDVGRAVCSAPAVVFGAAADGHVGVGGSGLFGYSVDIPHGRFGIVGQVGVGVGIGASDGGFAGFSPLGSNVASANLQATVGGSKPLLGAGGSATYNFVGSDPGVGGISGGGLRGGTGSLYADVGGNFALQTPSFYNLGCD